MIRDHRRTERAGLAREGLEGGEKYTHSSSTRSPRAGTATEPGRRRGLEVNGARREREIDSREAVQ